MRFGETRRDVGVTNATYVSADRPKSGYSMREVGVLPNLGPTESGTTIPAIRLNIPVCYCS